MTYKEKIEDFINDLNDLISDPILAPKYSGGKFELIISDDSCSLTFKEGDLTHNVYHSGQKGGDVNDYHARCYYNVLRIILLGVDSIGEFKNDLHFISFQTLFDTGLDKLRKLKDERG